MPAEEVVGDRVISTVIGEIRLSSDQTERLGLHLDRPEPHLRAHGAVALAGSGADIRIGLEADGTAKAAHGIAQQQGLSAHKN
jgi:hypothetical protein